MLMEKRMKRLWMLLPFLALLFGVTGTAHAQFTTVTAQVKDANNALYNNCQANINFVPSPTATTAPLIQGSTFQTVIPVVQCDSNGNFTATMVDNNQVSDGHTVPPGSQWQFNICSARGAFPIQYCFSLSLVITGTTQNITAQLQADIELPL